MVLFAAVHMSLPGTKRPIRDVRSPVANGGKADEICSGRVLLSLTLAAQKREGQSSARKKRIKCVALVNLSCTDSILVESILRESDQQKGFHAAKTPSRHKLRSRLALQRAPDLILPNPLCCCPGVG